MQNEKFAACHSPVEIGGILLQLMLPGVLSCAWKSNGPAFGLSEGTDVVLGSKLVLEPFWQDQP